MTFRYPFVCMIIEPVFPVNASPNVPTHLSLFGTMPSSLNSTLLSITSIWRSPLFSSTWEPSALTLLSPAINMINNQFRDLKSKFPRPQSDESSTFSVDLFLLQMIDVHLDLLNCLIEMMQAFSAYDPSDVTEQFLLGYCKAYSMLQGLCEAPPCLDLLSEKRISSASYMLSMLGCMFWCLGNSLNQLRRLLLANVLCGESMLPRLINNVILVFLCLIILCSLMHKWGFLPQSEGNAIKTRVTLFEMHQALKLHQGANNFHTRRTRRWHKENRFAHGSSI
ncbi:uncharacterized protein [Arachis hypogaea]|uniref:uncharacterized protein isoform X2 n=1 Tax=Arachis hypogaea TaxID=3818 RepID=UPI003B20DBD1